MNHEQIAAALTEAGRNAVRYGYCSYATVRSEEIEPLVLAYRVVEGGEVTIALNHTGLAVRAHLKEQSDAD